MNSTAASGFLQQQQSQQPSTGDEAPTWLKYFSRFFGVCAGLAAIGLGLWSVITIAFHPYCGVAGIVQMLIGMLAVLVEAPFCCMFLDFAQAPYNYFEARPYWHKGLLYVCLAIIPFIICTDLPIVFGSGLIFVTGSLYGLMTLGRKANSQDMRARASSMNSLLIAKNSNANDVEIGRTGSVM